MKKSLLIASALIFCVDTAVADVISDWNILIGGTGIWEWRPTARPGPTGPTPMTADFIATFTPFAMIGSSQFRTANAPPHLSSGAYAKAYDEVKAKGAALNSTRTQEETDIARFFADAPPNYWNRLLRDLAAGHSLNLGDSARMFALVNMAMADSLIAAWDGKIAWSFWRPVTAIRQGDNDGNPRTVGDPAWSPYFGTPNYPDYPSGANNLSGAATTMLENLFGADEPSFSLFSNTASPSPGERTYTRLSDAARDVVDARIFMGIHFRFADTVALRQGPHAANWAFGHFLRPLYQAGLAAGGVPCTVSPIARPNQPRDDGEVSRREAAPGRRASTAVARTSVMRSSGDVWAWRPRKCSRSATRQHLALSMSPPPRPR